ncbi:MAG TPA: NifB/NifX family molybdenum-iron cluster-binding protein [Bacteroidales bacterium]
MKKVALPLVNHQLSERFEHCSDFIIFTIKKNNNTKMKLVKTNLQPMNFPNWLAEEGVTDIITIGIENHSASKLNRFKINVFAGVEPSDPEQLVEKFLNGTLETNVILEES